jgi:hypothetical protein
MQPGPIAFAVHPLASPLGILLDLLKPDVD